MTFPKINVLPTVLHGQDNKKQGQGVLIDQNGLEHCGKWSKNVCKVNKRLLTSAVGSMLSTSLYNFMRGQFISASHSQDEVQLFVNNFVRSNLHNFH